MALVLVVVSLPGIAFAASSPPDWPTYHGSDSRAGVGTGVPNPHVLHAKRLKLDGAVYASPLVVKRTIIVATENNSLYAVSTSGRTLWRTHIGAPSPASERPCGNIDPLGITGTPAYSAATNRIYAVAELSKPVRHVLVAVDLSTGHVMWRKGLDLPGVDKYVMQQRSALALVGGRVWVAFWGIGGRLRQLQGTHHRRERRRRSLVD
jgi:hypothetical protein